MSCPNLLKSLLRLGQNFIEWFGTITIDNDKGKLIVKHQLLNGIKINLYGRFKQNQKILLDFSWNRVSCICNYMP